MAKVIVVAEVDDPGRWEKGFRSHGELFRSMDVRSPILLGTNENNEVAVLEEVADVAVMMESLNSPETIQAMESDGVKRDSVRIFILDKEFSF